MPVLEASLNPAYLMGILVFLVVIAMAIIRQKEVKAITNRFSKSEAKMVAFAVTFYGVESENKKPLKIQGALILTETSLVFQSRFGDRGYELPIKSIKSIGTTDKFCNKALPQSVVAINFNDENNGNERVAYRIPRPAQWVMALRKLGER